MVCRCGCSSYFSVPVYFPIPAASRETFVVSEHTDLAPAPYNLAERVATFQENLVAIHQKVVRGEYSLAVDGIFELIRTQHLVETMAARHFGHLHPKGFGRLLQACCMLQRSEEARELHSLFAYHNQGIRAEQYNWLIWATLHQDRDFEYANFILWEMEQNRAYPGYGWPDRVTYALMIDGAQSLGMTSSAEDLERRFQCKFLASSETDRLLIQDLFSCDPEKIEQLLLTTIMELARALNIYIPMDRDIPPQHLDHTHP